MNDSLVTFSNESLVFESGLLKNTIFCNFLLPFPFIPKSESLPSLMAKEQREPFALFHEEIALSLTKKRAIRSKN